MKDSIHSIRQSAKRFFSGTLLSRLAGMLRDMAMAYAFGTQAAIASFMVAFRLAHLLRRLFGEGALQSAFIPEFEALRHRSDQQAFAFFRDLAATLTIFLSLLIFVLCIGISGFLLWDTSQEANHPILFLTLLMLPSLLFICLFGLNASLLQCQKNYFIPSVAPVAFNAVWIAIVLYLKSFQVSEAMPWLAGGVILACFCQWLITLPQTLNLLSKGLSSSIWKGTHLFSPDVQRLTKPLILGILGVAATQINNAIDSLFAYYAEAEGPAMLWYAIRLQQLPLALFGIAIAGALLPPLSRALKAHDWDHYHHFLNEAFSSTFTLILPLTAILFVMGDSCINLLYGRGDFTHESIVGTTRCLWAYNIGLLPSALVLILAPAFYAQSNYRLPAIASFLTMFLNLILNTLFISVWGWGAMSVALATSLSAWVNLFFLGWSFHKQQGLLFSRALGTHFVKITVTTLIAFLGTYFFRNYFQQIPLSSILGEKTFSFPHHLLNQILFFVYQILCFGSLFFLSNWMVHLPLIQHFCSSLSSAKLTSSK